MKIAIIGAGASGITCAIIAKRLNKNLQIDMFDINSAIGKKILASGNGRCNISNTNVSYENYIGEKPVFTNFALKEFDFNDFEKFCKSFGLLLDIKESNKVYPLSNEAKSVVNLFEKELENLGVNLILKTRVKDIKKENEKFVVKSDENVFRGYDKVVIASGLGAAPQLNATEDGMKIASSFEHSYNPTYPSLVGLHTNSDFASRLQGIKKEANVTLYIDGKKENEIYGDVLFTKYGLSGFAILDISQYAVYHLELYQDVQVAINLFANIERNELLGKIETLIKANENIEISLLLTGIVSNKLAPVICEVNKIDKTLKAKDINLKQIRSIVNTLTNWRFKITDTQGFKHSEASGGGIRADEVNEKTYESKKCKNLYLIGEVLDIVGNRGGYNFQFAWSSGYIAGKSISKEK